LFILSFGTLRLKPTIKSPPGGIHHLSCVFLFSNYDKFDSILDM